MKAHSCAWSQIGIDVIGGGRETLNLSKNKGGNNFANDNRDGQEKFCGSYL